MPSGVLAAARAAQVSWRKLVAGIGSPSSLSADSLAAAAAGRTSVEWRRERVHLVMS